MWRLRPALPILMFSWSMLPTWPMVAMQLTRNVAHLAGGQTDHERMPFSLAISWAHAAGGADELSALAGVQLDVVDDGTDGDVGDGQAVAGLDVGVGDRS